MRTRGISRRRCAAPSTRLTGQDLPRAAEARGWPVRTPAEFERLLLDHLRDDPARTPQSPPALVDLVLAVEIGERLLAGNLCCHKMNRRLGCADPDGLQALWRLVAGACKKP